MEKKRRYGEVERLPTQTVSFLVCGDGSSGQMGLGPEQIEAMYPVPIPTLQNVELSEFKAYSLQNAAILVEDSKNVLYTGDATMTLLPISLDEMVPKAYPWSFLDYKKKISSGYRLDSTTWLQSTPQGACGSGEPTKPMNF